MKSAPRSNDLTGNNRTVWNWYVTISNPKTNQAKERVAPTPAGSCHECQTPGCTIFWTLCTLLTVSHNSALEQLTQRTNISYGLGMRIEILPIPVTRPNASSMRNVIVTDAAAIIKTVRYILHTYYGAHSRRLSGERENGREIRQRVPYEIPVLTGLTGKHYYYTYSATIQPPLTAHSSMKVHPRTCHECPEREMCSCTLSLTSGLDEGVRSSRPGRFTPGWDPVPTV